MKWTDENMQETYRTLDMDSSGVLEKQVWEQICARNTSFKRKTIWGLCAAGVAALMALVVWQTLEQSPAYLPNPGEFNRMQFAFYRELALPGQDLGISYDDFSQEALTRRSL